MEGVTRGRRVIVEIIYEHKNITNDLAPYLKDISFSEPASGAADDFQIVVDDKKRLWQGDWHPIKGDRISAVLKAENWIKDGETIEYPCGLFEIDEITLDGSATSGDTAQIKALSTFTKGKLREPKTKGWEKIKLKTIAEEVAMKNEITLVYETEWNPLFDRKDQREQSDLAFLLGLCQEAGLCLKVLGDKLVIFDEADYEKKDPICTIERGIDDIESFSFVSQTAGIYKAAEVSYTQGEKKKTISGRAGAKDVTSTDQILKINQKVDSQAEADRLALKELREANRKQTTGSLGLRWRPLSAGQTIVVKGWGAYDGKYFIDKTSHGGIGRKTQIKLDIHKVLEGY